MASRSNRRIFVYRDGKVVEVTNEAPKASRRLAIWPIAPDACGLPRPEMIEAAREHARKSGCPTEYTKDGRPIITSLNHYRKYCRAFNFYFRNDYSCGPRNYTGKHSIDIDI